MSLRAVARRYAKALIDVAGQDPDLARVEQDLEAAARLLATNQELRDILTSPVVPLERKRAITEAVFARLDAHPVARRLLALLASNRRLRALDEVCRALGVLADEKRRVVAAEMVTAVALSPDKIEQYRRSLERSTGRQVRLRTRLDPSILGGVVTRIGSEVWDGSLRGKLARLQHQLRGD